MTDENSEETLERITAALVSRWDPGDLAYILYHDEEYDENGFPVDLDLEEGDDPDLWEHFPLGLYTDSYAVDQAVDWSRRVLSHLSGAKKTLSHEEAIKRMHSNFAENYIMFATYWLEGNDPGPRPEGYGKKDYEDNQYDDDDEFFDPFAFFFLR